MGSLAGLEFIGVLFGLVIVALYAIAPLMLFAINGKLGRLIASQERIAKQLENQSAAERARHA
ncbi:MAG TPA: hypothetical protein VKV17_17915 [Bryobacteraceae bacterium]|nr:hypothetical protein [Bryobacteraceae bacterium]